MIDDMASLKQAMEGMDAQDPVQAQAARDRAAHLLRDAKLSFAAMAKWIEQRRLLLRPKILASIKRMDEPEMSGDAAFSDASSALRREGQSFRQIAEAIELNGSPAPRYEDPVQKSEPLYEMTSEPDAPSWARAANIVARIVFFPLRHPIQFLAIALPAIWLVNTFGGGDAVRQRADKAMSSVSERILRPSRETTAPPTRPAPSSSAAASSPSPTAVPTTASASPITMSTPPVTVPAPSANPAPSASEAVPPAPASADAPAVPSASTPFLDARGTPSKSAANNRPRTARRAFEDLMPAELRRNSRLAGPCIGGVGGCYWAGGRY